MRDLLLIGAGGALGAVARFTLSVWVDARHEGRFPWGTLVVNALGCLALGALMAWFAADEEPGRRLRMLAATGFLGAFTTFSTFGFETFGLLRDGRAGAALGNVALQLTVGLLAVAGAYVSTSRLLD